MVVSVNVKHVFKYPVHVVADTHLTKALNEKHTRARFPRTPWDMKKSSRKLQFEETYPTKKDEFVEKVVTIEHSVDKENGLDYMKRWAFCKNVVPHMLRKLSLLNEAHVVLEEETWQDMHTGDLHIKSRNITWSKHAIMREESKFSPHDENPHWTKFEQQGHLEIPNLGILGSMLETFANKFIHYYGVNKALNVMEELLQEKSSKFND